MKSAKTKAKELVFKLHEESDWVADNFEYLEGYVVSLLKEHERDTRSVAVQLAHNNTHWGVDDYGFEIESTDHDKLLEELLEMEVKDGS